MKERPFGGLNIIFTGDLWQLPPVKDVALFSNPIVKKDGERYDQGEQYIFNMFWNCNDSTNENRIQRLLELRVNNRSKDDPWLQTVLTADRAGEERRDGPNAGDNEASDLHFRPFSPSSSPCRQRYALLNCENHAGSEWCECLTE